MVGEAQAREDLARSRLGACGVKLVEAVVDRLEPLVLGPALLEDPLGERLARGRGRGRVRVRVGVRVMVRVRIGLGLQG